jgi:hypothetical protein
MIKKIVRKHLEEWYCFCCRGGVLILLRAFPANAAAFVGYEWTIQFLDLLERRRQRK